MQSSTSIQITRNKCGSNPHSWRFGVRYGIKRDTYKGHMANLPCRRGAPPSGRTHARQGSATPGCETVKPAHFLGQLCAYYALHLTHNLPRGILRVLQMASLWAFRSPHLIDTIIGRCLATIKPERGVERCTHLVGLMMGLPCSSRGSFLKLRRICFVFWIP